MKMRAKCLYRPVRVALTLARKMRVTEGGLWAAFDSRKQGWHDKLAGTFVERI